MLTQLPEVKVFDASQPMQNYLMGKENQRQQARQATSDKQNALLFSQGQANFANQQADRITDRTDKDLARANAATDRTNALAQQDLTQNDQANAREQLYARQVAEEFHNNILKLNPELPPAEWEAQTNEFMDGWVRMVDGFRLPPDTARNLSRRGFNAISKENVLRVQNEYKAKLAKENQVTLSPEQRIVNGATGAEVVAAAGKPVTSKVEERQKGNKTVYVKVYSDGKEEVVPGYGGDKWNAKDKDKVTESDLKAEAWGRIYAGKAVDADLSLLGLDKDPAMATAAKMVADDFKMMNKTTDEKIAEATRIAETLRGTGSSGKKYLAAMKPDPLGLR